MDKLNQLLQSVAESPEQRQLILMPVSRLLVEDICQVGDFYVFPPGKIKIEKLRPVPNKQFQTPVGSIACYSGQDLREVATSTTGFNCDVLANSVLVGFVAEIDWEKFLSQAHDDDIECLRYLSSKAARAFDLIRFHLCRFDVPDTLPGIVGSWKGSGDFLGALLYTLSDNESHLIAGSAVECSTVVKGIGLDLPFDMPNRLPEASDGEVAGIALHGLSMFSDVMTANTATLKFIRAMTLIEFLATPDEYRNWKKMKGDIVCHIAKDKSDYHQLMKRFEELSSIKDETGKQVGLRTLIVHHGRSLFDILPRDCDRLKLLRELQRYTGCVLSDMLENSEMSWLQFQEMRGQKKEGLGVA